MASNDMVVIQEYESNLKIIDQIIQCLDVQPVQVLIEAVIISVSLTQDTQLGVNFAVVDNLGQQLGTIGSGAVINSNVGFTPASVLTAAGKIASSAIPGLNDFASPANGIKYGFISNNITGFIQALETLGSTKILASPRILVLNKQRAEIQLGERLGFRSSVTQNLIGTTQQVQFLNTGTLLRLRPFVSNDEMVRMEIHPERSEGSVDPVTGLPSATIAELTTNVMVPNGGTLVIGGLMEDDDAYQQSGLPGLSRLPILGHLFGTRDKTDTRQELVVLLTPHIWSPGQVGGNPDALAKQGSKGSRGDVRQAPAATTAAVEPSPGLAPATLPPLPPLSSRSALPPVETTEVSRRTGLSGTLESQPEPLAADLPASSKSLADPQPVSRPQPARVAKVDPTVSQASLEAGRVSQSVRPAVPEEARPASRRHVVRPGEDFSSIARDYYGSARLARALW